MPNRLHLNWSLDLASERNDFVTEYIQQPEFLNNPLTEEELETIGNYLLWGKDEKGLNPSQKGEIQLETRNKTWSKNNTESLDALLEQPTFSESSVQPLGTVRPKIPREVFDRNEALALCPSYMKEDFKALFHQIDFLDMCIGFWEFQHGKRNDPPRAKLLKRFDQKEIDLAEQKALHWSQFKYLKCRHLLVELRRQPFTMRDSFKTPILLRAPQPVNTAPSALSLDTEIKVFPLGLQTSQSLQDFLFQDFEKLNPFSSSEEDITKAIKFYWEKKAEEKALRENELLFDFRELEHVYSLFLQIFEIEDAAALPSSNLKQLLDTLKFYVSQAQLSDSQKEILDLKIQHIKNQDIAFYINKKYKKNYTANYISTIFRQKIIPKINEAAAMHEKILEVLCFEESFKKCSCCGKIFLRVPENFVRKARSKDGLSNRCKTCDKNERKKKGGQTNEPEKE